MRTNVRLLLLLLMPWVNGFGIRTLVQCQRNPLSQENEMKIKRTCFDRLILYFKVDINLFGKQNTNGWFFFWLSCLKIHTYRLFALVILICLPRLSEVAAISIEIESGFVFLIL